MRFTKKRHQIIATTLIDKRGPCTSEELAILTNTSSRTIKSDMALIDDVFKENGARVVSKKSSGYTFEIQDPQKFDAFSKHLNLISYYYADNYFSLTQENLEIIRALLSEKGYVKLDDLTDALYLSKSSLRQDMDDVNGFITDYHLTIENVATKGLRVTGSEVNYRLCCLAAFGISYHLLDKDNSTKKFTGLFACDPDEFQAERKIMLHVIRENHYHVTDSFSQQLARYFTLLRNRLISGDNIELSQEFIGEIKEFKQTKLAREILEAIDSFFPIKPTENDIYFVAILLLCNGDYYTEEVTEESLKFFYEPILDLNSRLVVFIRHRWGIELTEEGFKTFISITVNLATKAHFGLLPAPNAYFSYMNSDIKKEPMAIAIAQSVATFYCQELKCELNPAQIFNIALEALNQINLLNYRYRKLNLCVVSRAGINDGRSLARRLKHQFPEYLDQCAAYELYEIRELHDFIPDYVILGSASYTYNYDYPVFYLNTLSFNQATLTDFKNEVILNGFQIQHAAHRLAQTMTKYLDCKCIGIEEVIRLFAYKHINDQDKANKLIEAILERERRLPQINYSSILFFEVNRSIMDEDVFEVYQLSEPIEGMGKNRIRNVIFMSFDFRDQDDILLAANHLLEGIYKDESLIDELMESDDLEHEFAETILDSLLNNGI